MSLFHRRPLLLYANGAEHPGIREAATSSMARVNEWVYKHEESVGCPRETFWA